MHFQKDVEIFTDGSCSGNPGPGGWGAILRYKDKEKILCGGEHETTNNRMEMTAVIEALKALKESCNVTLYTDSQYVCNSLNKGWANSWKKNGWKKSDNKYALNTDLWDILLLQAARHNIHFIWIKGHHGHPDNERCDKLAVQQTALHSNPPPTGISI